jgi:hypothetical protein
MGLLDRTKQAADEVRQSLGGAGASRDSEQHYRDLGMLAYLTATGRPIDEADRQRLISGLWSMEQSGRLPAFRLVTSAPPPSPPVYQPSPPPEPNEPTQA